MEVWKYVCMNDVGCMVHVHTYSMLYEERCKSASVFSENTNILCR
jgi:hypothetical protein